MKYLKVLAKNKNEASIFECLSATRRKHLTYLINLKEKISLKQGRK